jgi:hypothetical protein
MTVCIGAISSGPTHFGHASVFLGATSFHFCCMIKFKREKLVLNDVMLLQSNRL